MLQNLISIVIFVAKKPRKEKQQGQVKGSTPSTSARKSTKQQPTAAASSKSAMSTPSSTTSRKDQAPAKMVCIPFIHAQVMDFEWATPHPGA